MKQSLPMSLIKLQSLILSQTRTQLRNNCFISQRMSYRRNSMSISGGFLF